MLSWSPRPVPLTLWSSAVGWANQRCWSPGGGFPFWRPLGGGGFGTFVPLWHPSAKINVFLSEHITLLSDLHKLFSEDQSVAGFVAANFFYQDVNCFLDVK